MNKNRKKLTMESKIRTFSIKVYDEQLPDGWEDVCNRIRNYDASIAQIQGIRHYKDFLDDDFWQPSAEKPHYHIIGRFLNGKSFRVRNILADLNVVFRQEDAELINNHGLETVSHYPNMSVYLTHETEEAILDGKAKYGLDEIISNLTAEELLEIRAGYIRVGQNGGYKKTYNEMAELDLQARELGYNLGDFFEWHYNLDFGTRTNSKLKTIEKSYYDGVLRRVNENSNVVRLCVFIQGAKETGKTFNAEKALRHKRIRKVGGGGSGKFDRLLPSDEVIILDDDTCGNLLNMTDNYMCQTYRRQSNNPFWCGDYFIVTSNYSFREWLERCGLVTYNKDGSDNLLERIYEENTDYTSLIDSKIYGTLEKANSVNLYKIHGSVTYPITFDMSFTEKELTDLFLREKMLFETVSYKLATAPTIFWGIGILDNNTLDLICNSETYSNSTNPKWIVIYPTEENLKYVEDFQEQGFYVIKADTMELIEYLYSMDLKKRRISKSERDYADIFPKNYISDKLRKISVRRPVIDFFAGSEPQISDILSNNVTRISYFDDVANMILSEDTVLLIGIPGCGKSTLLLQLAFSEEIVGVKFWFNNITSQEAENLRKQLAHEKQTITIFIDNLYNNMEAFKILREMPNVKLVLAERALNFDYIKRSCNIDSHEIIDISNLCPEDVQKICKGMNRPSEDAVSLLSSNDNVSLLEIVFYASTNTLINERIKKYINDLRMFEDSDLKINLLELFALINYTSYCGVPCSMDMLIFYFDEVIDSYEDILYSLNKMTKIIVQYDDFEGEILNQDYLIMRSKLFAERSLKMIDKLTMAKVLNQFWNRINPHIIYRYDVLKKRAYDADITTNIFSVKEGQSFYEKMFSINNSSFVKHQYAIFLLRKKQYDLAWKQIDQAYTESEKKVFTIANTHAVILFEMNIEAVVNSDEELNLLKEMMQKSFGTLEYCITQDVRINYHALVYARNVIRYCDRFGIDEYSNKYISSSISQIEEILQRNEYMYIKIKKELKRLLIQLKEKKNSVTIT